MPREYRHISEYKKEIHELREKGLNLNEIGKRFKNAEKMKTALKLYR